MATSTARRGLRRWCGAAVIGCVVLASCAAPGASPERSPEVLLSGIGARLHNPVWSYSDNTLLGLTDDRRLAQVSGLTDGGSPRTRLSKPLATGRNIAISQKDHRQVFVPQPERGRVAVVDLGSLTPTDDFAAGPAPAYVAEDPGMRVLLALSADGSSVTPVDQYGYRTLPAAKVSGRPADTIDGANRGRDIDYHLYGPSGIRYYRGPSSPPEERGSLPLDVGVAAGDGTDAARSYVARPDDNVLYAVGSRRGGDGLQVLATARLPSPIRHLGTDDNRIYAATDHELVTLETASITGYPDRSIQAIHTVDYRTGLPDGPIRSAPLSGMAVGPHRVYLTLHDQPYVVGVAKPEL